MPAAPGQRAAQQPLRAAAATQRALGAAATAPDGGVRGVGVAQLNGAYYTVDLRRDAEHVLTPREPVPLVEPPPDTPPAPTPAPDPGLDLDLDLDLDIDVEGGGRHGCSADR